MSDIAIVGVSLNIPGAKSTSEFWNNLIANKESLSSLSEKKIDTSNGPKNDYNDPNYISAGGYIDDAKLFDADFFGYTAREAAEIDPQQRLLLEHAWCALEDAGHANVKKDNNIAVFASTGINNYLLQNILSQESFSNLEKNPLCMLGNAPDFIASRIAYKLNCRAQSMTIQTGCSSSLVAIHQARVALLTHQCDLSIVGGCALPSAEQKGYWYTPNGVASPDGHCRPFDEKAQGTVFSNGVIVFVLKRLDDAIKARDQIYSVIKSSALNNDGSQKAGYTAPSVEGQAQVITKALALSKINPETIGYVEAHGTATELGDPIEVEALSRAYRQYTNKKSYCALGGLKSNLGHLDVVAGLAGLLKVSLALRHKIIPATLHYKKANPKIKFENTPFFVNSENVAWTPENGTRRAGISAFGIGGTNAHVIVEETPEAGSKTISNKINVLPLSAKQSPSLDSAVQKISSFLSNNSTIDSNSLAFTLQHGRKDFNHRAFAIIDTDSKQLIKKFNYHQVLANETPSLIFMFTGQGAQYSGMAKNLYQTQNEFKAVFDRCCHLFAAYLDCELKELIFNEQENADAELLLKQTSITQPALFTVEYALGKLLLSLGLKPDVMMGHSIGEYAAACLAGVFTLEDAVKLVAHRGRLLQTLPSGAMTVVIESDEKINSQLPPLLSIAAVNSPGLCVVSGPEIDLKSFEASLATQGIQTRRLQTSAAFHSKMVEPILDEFAQVLNGVNLREPQYTLVSNVTGKILSGSEACSVEYWVKHVRQAVLFSQGIQFIQNHYPCSVFVEVGPGITLETLVKQHRISNQVPTAFHLLPHPKEQVDDDLTFLEGLANLWSQGFSVKWEMLYQHIPAKISLPSYSFIKREHWIEPALVQSQKTTVLERNDDINQWLYTSSWKTGLPVHNNQNDPKTWLVFCDGNQHAKSFVRYLTEYQNNCCCVVVGDEYQKISENEFTIDPQKKSHYQKLFAEIQTAGISIDGILSFLAFDDERLAEKTDLYQYQCFLHLIQCLLESKIKNLKGIYIFADNLIQRSYEDATDPQKATLRAFSKIIPQEFGSVKSRCVDISFSEFKKNNESLYRQLHMEISAKSSEDSVVLRGQQRWLEHFIQIEADYASNIDNVLPNEMTYIIFGGLGNIGFHYANVIANSVSNATLVFVGRSTLPKESEWSHLSESHPDATKIKKIQTLQKTENRILYLSLDMTDYNSLQQAMNKLKEDGHKIGGVVHAAGISGDNHYKALADIDATYTRELFSAKLKGLENIRRLCQQYTIPRCWLVSSISSVLGGVSLCAYAAAHLFIDTFGCSQGVTSTRWNVLNWDALDLGDDQTASTEKENFGATLDKLTIKPNECAPLLARYFRVPSDLERIVVSTTELNERYKQWVKREFKRPLKNAKLPERDDRPNLSNQYIQPQSSTEKKLLCIWQNVLGVSKIGIEDNFFELGGHSLAALELVGLINEEFTDSIAIVDIFEYPTIQKLSNKLTASHNTKSLLNAVVARSQRQKKAYQQRMRNRQNAR